MENLAWNPQPSQLKAEQALWQLDYERISRIIDMLHGYFIQLKKTRTPMDRPVSLVLNDTMELLNRYYTELSGLLDDEEKAEIDEKMNELVKVSGKLGQHAMRCPDPIYFQIDFLFKLMMMRRQEHGLGIPASIRRNQKDRITAATRGDL